jgi:hypothetical protein
MQVALDAELGDDAKEFLAECDVIDWQAVDVQRLVQELGGCEGDNSPIKVAQRCFEWVRD